MVWSNVGRKIGKKWVQRKYIKKVNFGREIGQLTLHGGKNERERVEGKRDIRRQRERESESKDIERRVFEYVEWAADKTNETKNEIGESEIRNRVK